MHKSFGKRAWWLWILIGMGQAGCDPTQNDDGAQQASLQKQLESERQLNKAAQQRIEQLELALRQQPLHSQPGNGGESVVCVPPAPSQPTAVVRRGRRAPAGRRPLQITTSPGALVAMSTPPNSPPIAVPPPVEIPRIPPPSPPDVPPSDPQVEVKEQMQKQIAQITQQCETKKRDILTAMANQISARGAQNRTSAINALRNEERTRGQEECQSNKAGASGQCIVSGPSQSALADNVQRIVAGKNNGNILKFLKTGDPAIYNANKTLLGKIFAKATTESSQEDEASARSILDSLRTSEKTCRERIRQIQTTATTQGAAGNATK